MFILKQQSCQNNPNESYTERKAIHEPCGYSLDLVCSFDSKEDEHSFYRGQDCIKKFCSELKELGTKVVNYEQKKNDTINMRRCCFLSKSKTMLHMRKSVLL